VTAEGAALLVAAAYLVMSLVTYLLYARDKRAARAGTWRTSELTLQLAALCCGWPGALLAQRVLRHKNRKAGFQLAFWVIVGLNVCALVAIAALLAPPFLAIRG
jgi:uncharacterized membrane protein YsdA (DUF1294 family)